MKPAPESNYVCNFSNTGQQEGLDARVRKKEEAKLEELIAAAEDHKRAERERIYAVRYHKVGSKETLSTMPFLA